MDNVKRNMRDFLNFLNSIDVEFQTSSNIPIDSFAPHIEIKKGIIYFNPEKALLMDLIHDAGHMALIPKQFRHLFNGNMLKGFQQYNKYLEDIRYSSVESNILEACNDPCVTAWAWAVGKHLGFAGKDVIDDKGYGGTGENIRQILSISNQATMPYIGVSQLHYGTYTKKYNRLDKSGVCYPHMNYWTADQALKANNITL